MGENGGFYANDFQFAFLGSIGLIYGNGGFYINDFQFTFLISIVSIDENGGFYAMIYNIHYD